jgi:hypothetical protein
LICYVCTKPKVTRPYGADGKEICFECLQNDPARRAEGERRMRAIFAAVGPNVVIDPLRGPLRMTGADLGDPRITLVMTRDDVAPMGIKHQPCPKCGTLLKSAACLEDLDARPSEGSVTVCAICAAVMVFEAGGGVRLASRREIRSWDRDQRRQIVDMQTQIRARSTGAPV